VRNWTRREVLQVGVAASAGIASRVPLVGSALASPNTAAVTPEESPNTARERLLLDFGWKFHPGHAWDPAQDQNFGQTGDGIFRKSGDLFGGQQEKLDDSKWTDVDLPHDWALGLPFENDPPLMNHGYRPLGRTYPATSIGWYQRTFEVAQSDLGKRLCIEFDGVFRDCMVVLNGYYLGRNESGYAPFRYDVTDFLNYGAKNFLVVRVDATENEGWFYEGAGIYRHVWLVKTNPVHVAHWGTYVTSEARPGAATASISTEVENKSDSEQSCRVLATVVDHAGKAVGSATSAPLAIPARSSREFKHQVVITNPDLWSLENPYLYRLVTAVEENGTTVDRYETPFGVRTIRFDPDEGFFLNGKPVKIKGTCNHQDHAGVGVALPDRIQYYRIEKLKEMGANGYRTAHNPPTPELLDACDRLGMLVMDETRTMSSHPQALSDLEKMIRRDRNHPSVILWSLGNEEPQQATERGVRIVGTMKRLTRRLDPTRPVTAAMNGGWGQGITAIVDVQGFNYTDGPGIDEFHRKFPKQPTIGSEVRGAAATRGIYANDKDQGYVSSYDETFDPVAPTAEGWWRIYAERRFLAGAFIWTGLDYRGEPWPNQWPCINSHSEIMDVCGFPKDNYYYYQAWWTEKPVLHLFPHWNWPGREGQEIDVRCYTNLDKVELFLNGASLGVQEVRKNSHVAWKVPYASGTLEARGYKGGQQVLLAKRETTGGPARIALLSDRQEILANGEDVAVVEVQVLDQDGRLVPVADNESAFQLSGEGKIIGVGNGDPSSHEPDKAHRRRAFNGLCVAIVQSTKNQGEIRLQAVSPGLEPATLVIRCTKATLRPAVA